MNRYLFTTLVMFCGLNVTYCERYRPPVGNLQHAKNVQLFLFASNDCHPCQSELPEIQSWFNGLSPAYKKRINPIVFYIAGPANKPANQSDADAFGKGLGLSFEIRADKYGKKYREYYKEGTAVPAAIIANEEGQAIKIYQPGKVSVEVLEGDLREVLDVKSQKDNRDVQKNNSN